MDPRLHSVQLELQRLMMLFIFVAVDARMNLFVGDGLLMNDVLHRIMSTSIQVHFISHHGVQFSHNVFRIYAIWMIKPAFVS